jgi:hypothetical protein
MSNQTAAGLACVLCSAILLVVVTIFVNEWRAWGKQRHQRPEGRKHGVR